MPCPGVAPIFGDPTYFVLLKNKFIVGVADGTIVGFLEGDFVGIEVEGDVVGLLVAGLLVGEDDVGNLVGLLVGPEVDGLFVGPDETGLLLGFDVVGLIVGVHVVGCLVGLSGSSLFPWHIHKIVLRVLHPARLLENFVDFGFWINPFKQSLDDCQLLQLTDPYDHDL